MYYKVTLTCRGGFTVGQVVHIIKYFDKCKHAYVVNEFGERGVNSHLEGIIEFDTKTTSNVTERIKRVYNMLEIDVVDEVTIKVKKVTHLNGAIIYASKELSVSSNVVLLKGWNQTWIDKMIKENVKDIPYKMLKKLGTRLTQKTGPAMIYEWCIANNMRVESKADYLKVTKLMCKQQYLFGCCRDTGLWRDVCSLFQSGHAGELIAESNLHFF